MKPYSQACENNKTPILNEIASRFSRCIDVFEIGSGTGQHAVFFSKNLPHLKWHTSDCTENHAGIIEWIDEAQCENVIHPIKLHVANDAWPSKQFNAVFTANTCHIMHWQEVIAMFEGVKRLLKKNGLFVIYGPFNYKQSYTSDSNERFDKMLRKRDPDSGIRSFEDIFSLASDNNLKFVEDIVMPANNRLLVFKITK